MSAQRDLVAEWAAHCDRRGVPFDLAPPYSRGLSAAIRSGVERGDPFAVLAHRPVGVGVDAGQRIRAANWPTLPAVTDEPVADDSHSPAPQVEIIAADADGQDANAVHHPLDHLASVAERQVCACPSCQTFRYYDRQKRWQEKR